MQSLGVGGFEICFMIYNGGWCMSFKSPSKCFDFPPLCSTKSQKWFSTPKACQRRNQSQPKLASGWGWWSCCVLRSKLNPMLWWVAGGVHFRSFSPVCYCYPNPFIRVGISFFIPSTPPGSTKVIFSDNFYIFWSWVSGFNLSNIFLSIVLF